MSVRIRLGSKRDVLVPPYYLQSWRSCCCLGYPGKNLGFRSFVIEMIALWALSYRFSMARMRLALMLYFLTVAHKALYHTLSRAFLSLWRHDRDSADAAGISRRGSWDRIFVLWCSLRLWNLLALLQWSLLLVTGVFNMTLLGWLIRMMVLYFWHSCKLPFFGSVITREWVHVVSHSPVFQILLQTEVRMSIMASPPVWTNSAVCYPRRLIFPALWLLLPSLLCHTKPLNTDQQLFCDI